MNTKNPQATFEASADSDAAMLAQFGLSDRPVMFAMRDAGGSVIQEKDACYQCKADGFYGRGRAGTWYEEGSIIVTDAIPNQHMEPLNRAAAIRWVHWASRLPQHKANIDVGDMAEAAQMLAKNPDVLKLDPEGWQEAVVKLAVRLKLKREGGTAPDLPAIAHNFAPQSGRGAAQPILGAKVSDMSMRGPGGVAQTLTPADMMAGGARRASAAPAVSNPLGGPTPTER